MKLSKIVSKLEDKGLHKTAENVRKVLKKETRVHGVPKIKELPITVKLPIQRITVRKDRVDIGYGTGRKAEQILAEAILKSLSKKLPELKGKKMRAVGATESSLPTSIHLVE